MPAEIRDNMVALCGLYSTTYNLARTEEGWRVLLCTAYDEARHHKERA